jgi:tRNA dimethylallyltransferase
MTAQPLLVITGPTASGKTRLGLEVAEALGGEIVSADAFAVYRGLDIGTDKPSREDRLRVPHHLVDVADPHHAYSAGTFAKAAADAVDDIRSRGRTPVVVGGTLFYLRALLLGLFPSPPRDPSIRRRLTGEWRTSPAALVERLREVDPDAADRIDPRDRQRVLRALEVYETTGEPMTALWRRHRRDPRYDALLTVPQRERADLYARIDARVGRMFTEGLVEEVDRILAAGVPPKAHALKAIGYREVVEMLRGRCDLDAAIDATRKASRRLAKRQLTWLRGLREGDLRWVAPAEIGGAAEVVSLWHEHHGRSEPK